MCSDTQRNEISLKAFYYILILLQSLQNNINTLNSSLLRHFQAEKLLLGFADYFLREVASASFCAKGPNNVTGVRTTAHVPSTVQQRSMKAQRRQAENGKPNNFWFRDLVCEFLCPLRIKLFLFVSRVNLQIQPA